MISNIDPSIAQLRKKIIGDISISCETIVEKHMFDTIFNYIIETYRCFGIIINKNEVELKSYDDVVSEEKKNNINRYMYGDDNIDSTQFNLVDLMYSGMLEKMTGMSTMGTYNKVTKDIKLKPGMKLDNFVSTLAHELCHTYIHQKNIIIDKPVFPTHSGDTKYGFGFQTQFYMKDGDIEEGICELMSLIIMEILLGKKIQCSNMPKYWYGWRTVYEGYRNILESEQSKQTKNYNKITYLILTLKKMFVGIQKKDIIESWIKMVPIGEKQSNICHDHIYV